MRESLNSPGDLTPKTDPRAPFDAPEYQRESLVAAIQPQLEAWKAAMEEVGFTDFRIELTGSLASGTYRGPKPPHFSFNPGNPFKSGPDAKEALIEYDVKVFLAPDCSPADPDVVERLKAVFSANSPVMLGTEPRDALDRTLYMKFMSDMPALLLYRYQEFDDRVGLEFEFAIVRDPGINTAPLLSVLFTSKEVEQQGDMKQAARACGADYLIDDFSLKSWQGQELAWRLTVAYGLQLAVEEGLFNAQEIRGFPELPPMPPFIREHAENWLHGKEISPGFARPKELFRAFTAFRRMASDAPDAFLYTPPEPVWLSDALRLRERHFSRSAASLGRIIEEQQVSTGDLFMALFLKDTAFANAWKSELPQLREMFPALSFTNPEDLHITLVYFGPDWKPEMIPVIRERMSAEKGFPTISSLGAERFGPLGEHVVLELTDVGRGFLSSALDLRADLRARGFCATTPYDYDFRPHVSLAHAYDGDVSTLDQLTSFYDYARQVLIPQVETLELSATHQPTIALAGLPEAPDTFVPYEQYFRGLFFDI